MLTIEQRNTLWQSDNFKKDVRFCANVIAQFIVSEPNYGRDYVEPASQIETRIISYWQKRYNLASRIIQSPEDPNLLKMLVYTLISGVSGINCPITFNADEPVYNIWDVNDETNSIAGYIKAVWNNLAGVRSNEYPWAGENGNIEAPVWYGAHFGDLPNKF